MSSSLKQLDKSIKDMGIEITRLGTIACVLAAVAAVGHAAAFAPGDERWAFATGGRVYSSPAVSPDGASIFVGSSDSKVYALNAATEATTTTTMALTPSPSHLSPSPSNGPDIEGSLMEAAQKYPNCQCTLSWQEIRRSNPRTRTGGLGEFLVEGKYEVWVCLQDNVCSTLDDSFCYVFNEQTLTFEAWGLNAEVKVVKNALQ